MSLSALNALLLERPRMSYANLLVDRNAEPQLFGRLKEMPLVSAIMLRRAAIAAFHDTLGSQIMIFVGLFAGFACALGFGVTYNSTRIALSERGRELATLRVLGFTQAETAYILLGEMMMLILVAMPAGCFFGWGLCYMMAAAFDTELFRVPLVINPSTYGVAVLIALLAAALSSLLVGRRVSRLDIIRVLKTRE
jgi:putative ABC transport system permease protein